jgi:hypothetical protein
MLRHEDVTEDIKSMPLTEAFEEIEKDCSRVVVIEIWKTLVTTERDEVIVAEGVVTLEVARHGRIEYRWVPRSWTYFVHARGMGFPR